MRVIEVLNKTKKEIEDELASDYEDLDKLRTSLKNVRTTIEEKENELYVIETTLAGFVIGKTETIKAPVVKPKTEKKMVEKKVESKTEDIEKKTFKKLPPSKNVKQLKQRYEIYLKAKEGKSVNEIKKELNYSYSGVYHPLHTLVRHNILKQNKTKSGEEKTFSVGQYHEDYEKQMVMLFPPTAQKTLKIYEEAVKSVYRYIKSNEKAVRGTDIIPVLAEFYTARHPPRLKEYALAYLRVLEKLGVINQVCASPLKFKINENEKLNQKYMKYTYKMG